MLIISSESSKEMNRRLFLIPLLVTLVMSLRLTNTLSVFHVLVNDFLRDMLNCFVYFDDISIYFRDIVEDVHHMRLVL